MKLITLRSERVKLPIYTNIGTVQMPRDRRVGARNFTSRHCWAISVLKSERVVRYRTHLRSFLSPSLYPLLESSPSLLVRRERKDSRSMPDRPLCSDRGPGDKEQGCYHRGAGRSRYACFYVSPIILFRFGFRFQKLLSTVSSGIHILAKNASHFFSFLPLERFSLFCPFCPSIRFICLALLFSSQIHKGPFTV